MTQSTAAVRSRVAALGAQFNPDIMAATHSLYAGLVEPPPADVRAEYDIAYGPDARQTVDVYHRDASGAKPVLCYVPGGGFTGGDKRLDDTFYGNIAQWFVARGFVVVTMNYRLAPELGWPSGAEDVGSALAWTAANIARYGGDPARIFVFGQSAGASHTATFLYHPKVQRPVAGLTGVVLASGVYRIPEDRPAPNLISYFGADVSQYMDRSPLSHVATNKVPLLLTVAEFDPAHLSAPTYQLAEAVTRRDGRPPQVLWLAGHNHVSTVLSFGTGDDAFGQKILAFFEALPAK